MAGDPDKAQLIAELAAAWEQLAQAGRALEEQGAALKAKLDLPKRVAASYRAHKPAWLAGAALLGLVLSRLPARKKVVYVERSTGETLGPAGKAGKTWRILKFVTNLAKPMIVAVVGQRLQDLAEHFAAQQQQSQPPPTPEPRPRRKSARSDSDPSRG
jgi:hypothetical protein